MFVFSVQGCLFCLLIVHLKKKCLWQNKKRKKKTSMCSGSLVLLLAARWGALNVVLKKQRGQRNTQESAKGHFKTSHEGDGCSSTYSCTVPAKVYSIPSSLCRKSASKTPAAGGASAGAQCAVHVNLPVSGLALWYLVFFRIDVGTI